MRAPITLILSICLIFMASTLSARQYGGGRGGYGGKPKGPSITGKISGQVEDADSGEPVPFASIVLQDAEGKDQNGTVSEEDGSFKLTEVKNGSYTLLISFVGYEVKKLPVEVTLRKPNVNLERITLSSTVTALQEVVVEGQQEIIENKIDRIVYNAESDVANAGGNASDVLRRTPLLSVDLQGNVSLRGSSNVQILVNGKPSTMFASNPGDALQSIPSDQIKSVEVITSPSAKYDGEGSAGIINIITKKKTIEGITGNVNLSVGTRQNSGNIGLNAAKGRFGINVSGNSYYSWPRTGDNIFLREEEVGDEERVLREDGNNRGSRLGFFGNLGAFYDFNAFNSLLVNGRIRGYTSDGDGVFDTRFSDPSINLLQEYQRTTVSDNLFSGYELSADYIKKFPGNDKQEFSLAYKVDGNVQDRDFAITQEDMLGNDLTLFRDERNINEGDNAEHTFQFDYVHPIGTKTKIETGAKGVVRRVSSDYQYDIFDTDLGRYVTDVNQTDVFDYDQDVYAGYISTTTELGEKYGLIAGVRYEYTDIAGRFASDRIASFGNDYDNWLPSITLSKKLKKFQSLKVSYNKRIQRPSLFFINPYQEVSNNRNITFGNPDLLPEITDQAEVGLTLFIKKVMINTSLFYRHTNDVIESFLQVNEEGISVTTYRNIGTRDSYGTNIFSSVTLWEKWTIRGGFNLSIYDATGTVDGANLSRTAVLFNGNINSSYKLGNNWTIDLFGFYRARRQTLQGFNPSFSIMGMGIKKEFWDKKGSLGIRIIEPFFENKAFGSELEGDGYYQFSEAAIPFRSFGITMGIRFGQFEKKVRRRNSRIRNEDLKNGGDGQGNGF